MKQENEIYIKPENRISAKDMQKAGFGDLKETGTPVVEMEEGRVMPVYIFGAPLVLKSSMGEGHLDLMLVLSHHIKEKKLELKGRMRYADTGRKTVFSIPQMFDVKDYDDARQQARDMYLKLIKETPMKPSETAWELEIPIGTNTEDTMQLMDESDHFNIGIAPKK